MTLLSLRAGWLEVDLAPQAGGSIARFSVDGRHDVLRATPADVLANATAANRGNDTACYPLLPFSNRIAGGRLSVDGREIVLRRNWPGVNHPMHGDGWARAWKVERHDQRSAEIAYDHAAASDGGWPFAYRARQSYRLDEDRLTVRISLENREAQVVPAGIGLHPFFVRDAATDLQCRTKSVWLADAEVLPTERVTVPAAWDFSAGRRIGEVALDNCFEGWDGQARIAWPNRGLALEMMASEQLRTLVIFTPPQRPFFCVEPVSHANGRIAATRLAAGDTIAGEVTFRLTIQ
ncbi:MAG: aldose 1-epimerase [Reyranella sp.]|uniref:aldose 1-epimerase n=1 Tax=Reyranella sp. TaxID=1929291 RepID=UPI003D108A83